MSLENVKAYLEKCRTDPSFAKALAEATTKEAHRQLLSEHGFSFTAAEYSQLVSELTVEDLETVVGGVLPDTSVLGYIRYPCGGRLKGSYQ
jgi:predicted ribosomally synthesized peptide with nif11-like leader